MRLIGENRLSAPLAPADTILGLPPSPSAVLGPLHVPPPSPDCMALLACLVGARIRSTLLLY
ncbi:hypothetical protein CGMCC3_g17165 [Colletotrichum fructicola]|nr:uncharacterized protein CGMCC3_g17165 [Colletotrichum fructicola]KAE9566653.1 hypothetical protein CGMCC3_g17165 [Colletotrichum fructicola]